MTDQTPSTQHTEGEGRAQRRSRFVASSAALKQISAALSNKELKTRKTDKVTNLLALGSVVVATTLFLFPSQTAPIIIVCDCLIGLAILFYVAQRLGIFVTFNDRQTLLTAELLFGTMLAAGFIFSNVIAMLMLLRQMISSFSHPTGL